MAIPPGCKYRSIGGRLLQGSCPPSGGLLLLLVVWSMLSVVSSQFTPFRTTTHRPYTTFIPTTHRIHTPTVPLTTFPHKSTTPVMMSTTGRVTTASTTTAFPLYTQSPVVSGNLTGDHICPRPVIETRYVWKQLTFECVRKEYLPCWRCEGCAHFNGTHCIKVLRGQCSAKVYQYEPVQVNVQECCEGYEQRGTMCLESVECKDNNGGCPHICRSNKELGRHCECYQGYHLQGDKCVDFDECTVRNGDCSDICMNTVGSFYCRCRSGRDLISPLACNNSNPCQKVNGGCEHMCTTTQDGTHYCQCRNGFELINGRECRDINECALYSPCAHKCLNRIGSYVCRCPDGQFLDFDNKTCIGPGVMEAEVDILRSPAMIGGLSAVGAVLLLVTCVWIVCCYIRGICCCEVDKPQRRRLRDREDVQAIVVQYSNRNNEDSSPPAYANGGHEEYGRHARTPNGLSIKEEMDGEIHIIPDVAQSRTAQSGTSNGQSRH